MSMYLVEVSVPCDDAAQAEEIATTLGLALVWPGQLAEHLESHRSPGWCDHRYRSSQPAAVCRAAREVFPEAVVSDERDDD